MRLILASGSPRRAELLASARFEFEVVPADVDEITYLHEEPAAYVLRVATSKAERVARDRPGATVLAADTVVVAGGRIMGKPIDNGDAESMLKMLSGSVHTVLTAVVLHKGGRMLSDVVSTRVRFLPLTAGEIAWYIATGEQVGKAGAYAIQGAAARFIDWIDGSWSNVVGLPLASVYSLLKELGDAH
jgi:septum formation protein